MTMAPNRTKEPTPLHTAAIFFHPEAYSTKGPRLMGRHAAGESFLAGFFRHHQSPTVWAYVSEADHAKSFQEAAQAFSLEERVSILTKENLQRLSEPGCLFLPGPNLTDFAWNRSFFSNASWSLCGITHTTASATAMDAIAGLISGPVQPWDALICTSPTVKQNVEKIMQAQVNYLQERLGIQRLVLPQLPVIPLGIHCDDFAFTETEKARARKALNINEDSIVVLFAGRLSFHAKAHPLAMYQALQNAQLAVPKPKQLVLLELGWFANEPIALSFREAAQWAAPALDVRHLDGRDPNTRRLAWAVADVFCSLADNLQETFGITPIEAMAAGLPTVVSDWDGYRGTVEHGVTGFRIPTTAPSPGHGQDLAQRHALGIDTYDFYCGFTSSLVSIDPAAASQAFEALFKSSDLRREMGATGRRVAKAQFDWSVILKLYESLWEGLAEIRRAASSNKPQLWPSRMDPFEIFSGYPSRSLEYETILRRRQNSIEESMNYLENVMRLSMVSFARPVMPTTKDLGLLLHAIPPQGAAVGHILQALSAEKQLQGIRGLAWLLKLALLEVSPTPQLSKPNS
jgi:alpha-maltose-1-phosphate synthase